MSFESGCHFFPLLQYTTAIPFSMLQSINRYGFCILNAHLPGEATRLKTSIIFVTRTMETRDPSIVLKTHKCLLACDTRCLANSTVDVRTMRREHFAIYASLFEVNFKHPPLILAPSSTIL